MALPQKSNTLFLVRHFLAVRDVRNQQGFVFSSINFPTRLAAAEHNVILDITAEEEIEAVTSGERGGLEHLLRHLRRSGDQTIACLVKLLSHYMYVAMHHPVRNRLPISLLAVGTSAKMPSQVESPFYCNVSICTPSGHRWVYATFLVCHESI
jgi:hypothetical protein